MSPVAAAAVGARGRSVVLVRPDGRQAAVLDGADPAGALRAATGLAGRGAAA